MPGITSNEVIVGIKRATVWQTAVAVTGANSYKARCSSISVSGGAEEGLSRDIGFDRLMTETVRLRENYTWQATFDLTSAQAWVPLVFSCLGTEAVTAEQTASQGDYIHNCDVATSTYNNGRFFTIAWTIEDAAGARIIELPSAKVGGFTLNQDVLGFGTVTVTGVCDRPVVSGWTTTYANLTGLSDMAGYEALILGGTNAYFRINTASGSALALGDNKQFESYSISFNRPLRTQHVLNGANSAFTVEPREIDRVDGTLQVRYREINASVLDGLDQWRNRPSLKAELFFDGSQIGTGLRRSMRVQFPLLQALPTLPSGYDVPNNNSLMTPTVGYRMLRAASAPAGMTGITNYMRMAVVDTRSTIWLA